MDPAHLQILHQEFYGRGKRQPETTTRGYIDEVQSFEFYATEYGLMKKRAYKTGVVDEHPVVFPSILRQGPSTQFRTPIDDEHTGHVHVMFRLTEDGSEPEDAFAPPVEYEKPYKTPADKSYPNAIYDVRSVLSQDHMAWEDPGADRGPVAGAPQLLGWRRRAAAAGAEGADRARAARRRPARRDPRPAAPDDRHEHR